jgi:hypothetical protein
MSNSLNMKEMKKNLLIFLFIAFTINLYAQIDSNYVWSYQLEEESWKNWDSINHVWLKEVYFACLKENNLKMSCASCVYIYIDAGLTIDSLGKLTDIKIFKENICSNKASEKLKQCFFSYYKNLVFPKSLRNRRIKAKLGTGLSC